MVKLVWLNVFDQVFQKVHIAVTLKNLVQIYIQFTTNSFLSHLEMVFA